MRRRTAASLVPVISLAPLRSSCASMLQTAGSNPKAVLETVLGAAAGVGIPALVAEQLLPLEAGDQAPTEARDRPATDASNLPATDTADKPPAESGNPPAGVAGDDPAPE